MTGKFEVDDRVRHKTINQIAVVREVRGEMILLHWGTEYNVEYTNWVHVNEVELVHY